MALKASLWYDDGFVALNLYPDDEPQPKAEDELGVENYDPGDRLWFYYWDDEAYENGERVLRLIEINDIGLLRDEDLEAIGQLDLPRLDVAEAGLFDVTATDVLRWAQKTFPSRYSAASA